MPSAQLTFESPAAPAAILAVLRDLDFLSASLPNIVKVEKLDEKTALWTIRLKVGFLERTSVYRGELLSATDSETEFRAVGPEATVRGKVTVRAAAGSGSTVTVSLEATGSGALRAVIENVLAQRLPRDVADFARRVQERVAPVQGP